MSQQEPAPKPVIAYADTRTDRDRGLKSLDRAMTARLAKTIGVSLACVGGILAFLLRSSLIVFPSPCPSRLRL